jgi:hypothetical protein
VIPDQERDLGEQPLARLLTELGLKPHDLGRRLTRNVQGKLLRALNTASGNTYALPDLFTY